MIDLPASVRVYLCLNPCDMRRSFDGLHALVRDHLALDAFAGHLYVFTNRRKEQARFRIPIGLCGYRVSMASSLWKAIATVSTHKGPRWRGCCSR
jgi:transposase